MHPKNDDDEAHRQYEIAKKLLKEFEDDPDAEETYFVALYGRARRRQARTRKSTEPARRAVARSGISRPVKTAAGAGNAGATGESRREQ